MHPLAAIIIGALLIATGGTGLCWLFATTVNRAARFDLWDEHLHRLVQENQRV